MERILETLRELMAIDSPTGMTRRCENYVVQALEGMGYRPEHTRKGSVICELKKGTHPILLTAHLDTLGAMVRAIKPNGCLRYSGIGGWNGNSIENECVRVYTRDGKVYSATVQSVHASRHVWGDTSEDRRNDETLEVVLDEKTYSAEETRKLGIRPGDFIAFEPRMTVTPSGFVKRRFLDDKASAAVLLELARKISEGSIQPVRGVTIAFTVYEEIGHGASALFTVPCEDMIAVDMGCVGSDLEGREDRVSICCKDAAGPYDYDFTTELMKRCQALDIDYASDVFPRYSSDTATALKAGLDARFACIGMGVYASHGYERTHVDGIRGTIRLLESCITQL